MFNIPLILFAKSPEVGKVKTRLTPNLNMQQAAGVAKVMLDETLKLATQTWPGKVVLAVWPNLESHFIQKMLSRYNIDSIVQVKGDLGKKMFVAMEQNGYPCAVMGCDVPHCPEKNLLNAYQELSNGKNVIGPTLDGGYYLLGLQQSNSILFDNTQWGGEDVLRVSMETAQLENITFSQLETLSDIDTYADLIKASETLVELKTFLKNE